MIFYVLMNASLETGSGKHEKFEQPQREKDSSADKAYFVLYRNVQVFVMMRMYRLTHPDVMVDINNKNANPKELRGFIGQDWIDLYADSFKEYAKDYLDRPLSLDPAELDRLTTSFKEFYDAQKKATLH